MRQWVGLPVIVLSICLASPPGDASSFDPFAAVTIDSEPGALIPTDLSFQDEAGHATDLKALADGRPIVLAPVLHKCPNICGVTLGGLGDAVAGQPRSPDFVVIALSIDPRETPLDAAASLTALQARQTGEQPRNFHALTGTAGAVASIMNALGYRYAYDPDLHQFAHAAAIAVLTREGRLVRWIYGLAPDPDELGAAIVSAQGGKAGSLGERLILLCYHYDPHTGRYTLLVTRLVQVAGTAAALALTVGIVMAWRRERMTQRGKP